MKSPRRLQIEAEVHAMLIDTMVKAEAAGRDPYRTAEAEYPGVPELVLIDAWVKFDSGKLDAWWDTLKRTIDGEVLREAVTSLAPGIPEVQPRLTPANDELQF